MLCAGDQTQPSAREVRLSQGGRLPGRAPENCGLAEASGTPEVGARQGSGLSCRQVPAGLAPPKLRGLLEWAPPPCLARPQAGLAAPPWAPGLFPLPNSPPLRCSGHYFDSSERFSKASQGKSHSFCCPNVHAPSPAQSWFRAVEAFPSAGDSNAQVGLSWRQRVILYSSGLQNLVIRWVFFCCCCCCSFYFIFCSRRGPEGFNFY